MRESSGLTAILLAAGVGRRMGSTLPKSMLPLNGESDGTSFLEHVSILKDLGVADVRVVLSADVAREVTIEGASVVVNDFDTRSTGSTLSLLCAREGASIDSGHGSSSPMPTSCTNGG